MRDLSLHVLDLIENSTRAGASLVHIAVIAEPAENRLEITVEDNGPGLRVEGELALDPFYTTKRGKKTGLGLSLLRATAERAGGALELEPSAYGGLRVRATLELDHVDRLPLGDMAATLSSVACTNPELDLLCDFRLGARSFALRLAELKRELPADERNDISVAGHVARRIRDGLGALGHGFDVPVGTIANQKGRRRTHAGN